MFRSEHDLFDSSSFSPLQRAETVASILIRCLSFGVLMAVHLCGVLMETITRVKCWKSDYVLGQFFMV